MRKIYEQREVSGVKKKNFVDLFCENLAAIPYVTFYNQPPKSRANKSKPYVPDSHQTKGISPLQPKERGVIMY